MGKKGKGKSGVVYSTNPDFEYTYDGYVEETLPPEEQLLVLAYQNKGRGGKEVTIIERFVGTEDDLKDLGALLKKKCGVGGSVKDGEILIQGDRRKQVREILQKEGYKVKN